MATNPFKQERKDYAKSHRIAERRIRPIFNKALKQTIKPVIDYANVIGLVGLNPALLINQSVWATAYTNAFNMLGMTSARKEYYHQRSLEPVDKSAIDIFVDIWFSKLRDYALTYTYQIQRELNQTTINIINSALASDELLGLDKDGSVRLFIRKVGEAMRLRSNTISRTEATKISNLGKEIGARSWIEEQGGEGYKAWLGRNDSRERLAHLQENNIIIGIDNLFNLDGHDCQRPGDKSLPMDQSINCRCTCTYMSSNRYSAYVKRGLISNGKIKG